MAAVARIEETLQAVPYVAGRHRDEIERWCAGWDMPSPDPEWLPRTGYIVPGVIAAWLYCTDSALGFVECVISNPTTDRATRVAALTAVVDALEEHARRAGIKWLQGQSKLETVVRFGESRGWQRASSGVTIIVKTLG